MRWTDESRAELAALWSEALTGDQIAARFENCNRGEVYREGKRLGLAPRPRGRRPNVRRSYAFNNVPYVSVHRRIPSVAPGGGRTLSPTSRPVVEGRTSFRSTVRPVDQVRTILKSGHNQRKVGKRVVKGRWRGFEIYCLTLEERATCPRSCSHWLDCYGNNMHLAERVEHGRALERSLWAELDVLQRRHPGGFVVRLHILGDFYSLGYVDLWRRALEAFPALHCFGYTARTDAIGLAVLELSDEQWDRFAIRLSGFSGEGGATTYAHGEQPTGIPCPAQSGKTECCATCSLCWATVREISFASHARAKK